jgi:uncharacterized membrane protein
MNRWLLVSVAATVVALAAGVGVYLYRDPLLPKEVYTHWDANDKPNSKPLSRDDALPIFLIMPGAMTAFIGLTLALPWLSPKNFKVDEFRATYNYAMFLVVLLMGWLQAAILLGTAQSDIGVGRLIFAGVFLFFALLGNVLGKVRRNFWIGVRTPWTLASEAVWDQTHRLAAWFFAGAGVLGFLTTVVSAVLRLDFLPTLIACMAMIGVAALAPVFYSLVLYKRLEKQGKL